MRKRIDKPTMKIQKNDIEEKNIPPFSYAANEDIYLKSKNEADINPEIITEDKVENESGTSNKYFCVDNLGIDTVITIVSPKNAGSSKQIYIANDDMIIENDLIYFRLLYVESFSFRRLKLKDWNRTK